MTATTVFTPPPRSPLTAPADRSVPAVMAIEAVLLWPRGRQPADRQSGMPWPVLALVLGDRTDSPDRAVRRLFALLRARHRADLAVLDGCATWTVVPGYEPLLRLSVRGDTAAVDLDIVLPAGPIRGLLPQLASGGVVAVTTRRHADRLAAGSRMGEALRGLVLVNCHPAPQLAELAQVGGAVR